MELASRFDIRFLFDRRQEVHDTLSKARLEDLGVSPFTTVAMLSSRDEIWGAYLLATAATFRQGVSPWSVIDDFSHGDAGYASDFADDVWAQSTMSALPSSSEFIKYAIAEVAFVDAAASTELLQDCIRQDGGQARVLECLRRGLAGA